MTTPASRTARIVAHAFKALNAFCALNARTRRVAFRALSVAVLPLLPASELAAQQAPPAGANPDSVRTPCRFEPIRKQFDFWIGAWDVHPWAQPGASGARMGTNTIVPDLEHCVLVEHWTGAGGGSGKSWNWYDRNLGNWRQLWVATGGGTLDYTHGEFRDGAMRFRGHTVGPRGRRIEQRLTFSKIHDDTVRQLFETSADSGRTWTPGFDGRYIRRATR